MENSTAELTTYGITCLDVELLEGQLAALYRKGRIDLIYKVRVLVQHNNLFSVKMLRYMTYMHCVLVAWQSLLRARNR
jgi:hypothetical protein